MTIVSGNNRFRTLILTSSLVCAPALFADLSNSPAVPPANGIYNIPDTCVSVVCLENITLSDFTPVSSMISGADEVTVSDVNLYANLYKNVSGTPGAFISPVVLSGPIDITYFTKATLSDGGTFADQITFLNLTGSFTGVTGVHQLQIMLNPLKQSLGETTIEPLGPKPPPYQITSYFDVYAELKIDQAPFAPGPERVAELTPEPAYYGALGFMLAAMLAMRSVHRRNACNRQARIVAA